MNPATIRHSLRLAASIATILSCGLTAGAVPTVENVVVLKDVTFRGGTGSSVKLVKEAGVDVVAMDGATAVIGFERIVEKAAGKAALSSCTFVLRAVDKKAHRVSFAFGKLGSVSLTETDTEARLMPAFPGASSYAVRVFEKGKLARALSGQTAPLTVEGFDVAHDGKVDALSFDLTYAKENKDAWSITLTHDHTVVVLTPEGQAKTLSDTPAQIAVQTTGVDDGFVLVREVVTVSPL